MKAEARLVRKGRDVSLKGLLDQARVHLQLQKEHAARLRRAGWTEEHGAELAAAIEKVEDVRGDALGARDASKANLRREQEARARTERLRRKLVLASKDLRAEGRMEESVWGFIKGPSPRRRSTAAMIDYLLSIAGMVERYDPLLAPYFAGESAFAELRAVCDELEAAQGKQEFERSGLPIKTREVYLAKARLLGLIDKLNRIGRIAFADDRNARRLFDKGLIERATKRRVKEAPSP